MKIRRGGIYLSRRTLADSAALPSGYVTRLSSLISPSDTSDPSSSTSRSFRPTTNASKKLPRSSLLKLTMSLLISGSLLFIGCNDTMGMGTESEDSENTSGPEYTKPAMLISTPNIGSLEETGYYIDTSSLAQGYVSAAAVSSARLKFQVSLGDTKYNYDLPNDGTPIVCPINMGTGSYTFTVWENTTGNNYFALSNPPVVQDVQLESEFEPFLRPSFFCEYSETSACVQKANELCAGAKNQADVLLNIYDWIVQNVDYDSQKAASVQTGYVPNPDSTLQSGLGICFDYASLAAAMLRSQGIPCKIMTGYVSPDNIYHAWNMVYIDGTWEAIAFTINPNTWTRIDTTFAAGGSASFVGDGTRYTDRYTY